MTDLVSIVLGGGSIFSEDGAMVGPQSIGNRLTQDARVFGGLVMTATDIAVALGRGALGRDPHVSHDIAMRAGATIDTILADVIDRMKTTATNVPDILVGGGAILLGQTAMPGVASLLRPEHGDVANAIGAALA